MAGYATESTIRRRVNVLCVYLLVVVAYLVLGGVTFTFLEQENENDRVELSQAEVNKLHLNKEELEFLEEKGFCRFPSPENVQWTVGGAVFYSLTVITTIGYGSFAPRTLWGRVFTVFYAMMGISVIGLLLANIASVGGQLVKSFAARSKPDIPGEVEDPIPPHRTTCRNVFTDPQLSRRLTLGELKALIIHTTSLDVTKWEEGREGAMLEDLKVMYQDSDGLFDMERAFAAVGRWYEIQAARPTHVSTRVFLITFGCCALWVFGWSAVFMFIEGWLYHDAVWFSCVTLSTIGFGDFVPMSTIGRVLSFAFIAPGIGMVASFISCITNSFESSRFWLLQRMFKNGVVSEKVLVAQGVRVCLHDEERRGGFVSLSQELPSSPCGSSPRADSVTPTARNPSPNPMSRARGGTFVGSRPALDNPYHQFPRCRTDSEMLAASGVSEGRGRERGMDSGKTFLSATPTFVSSAGSRSSGPRTPRPVPKSHPPRRGTTRSNGRPWTGAPLKSADNSFPQSLGDLESPAPELVISSPLGKATRPTHFPLPKRAERTRPPVSPLLPSHSSSTGFGDVGRRSPPPNAEDSDLS